jgi:APA family basic amino acid/polyamine antiporter
VVRSGDTAFGLTAIKVMFLLGLALTVFGLSGGHVANYAALNEGGDCTGVSASARGGFAGFGAAVLGALWAFDGWSNVAPMVGELKDPMRNAPRAFLGGLGVVAFVYLLVTASYLYALTPTQIASVAPTSTVATEVLRGFLGPAAVAMLALAMAVSAFGSQQASALAGARIGYAMAADGGLPRSLAALSAHTASPTRAIWAQASLASVLALSGSFDALTDGAMVGVWFFVGLSVVAIYVIRAREPDTRGIFRCPGYPLMPAVFLLVVAAVLLTTLMANPSTALVSGLLIAAGLPVYQWMQR